MKIKNYKVKTMRIRGGPRTAATSKINLGCCSSPRSTSEDLDQKWKQKQKEDAVKKIGE